MSVRGLMELLRLEAIGQSDAGAHAQKPDVKWAGVGFEINRELFVAPIGEIVEVIDRPSHTDLFHVQPWLLGLIQSRGSIFTLVSLGHYFGKVSSGRESKVMLIQFHGLSTGLLVSKVFGIQYFSAEQFSAGNKSKQFSTQLSIVGRFTREAQQWHVILPSHLVQQTAFKNAVMQKIML